MKRLDVDPGQLPAERVLGVEWCIKSYTVPSGLSS